MVALKKVSLSIPHSDRCFAPPRFRPPLVFSRDDASGVRAAPPATARILIVEDDFLIASDIEAALSEAGMEITGTASSAEEALKMADADKPALAVMDIRLVGERDGVDAALDLFRTYGIRCVFASAHADEGTRTRAEPAHPLGWIPKPYAMASLVEAVRSGLKQVQDGEK